MNRNDQDKIFTFLLVSAKGCIEEPHLYGPLRLLDAFSMLLSILNSEETDDFYFELDKKICELKGKCMTDEKLFVQGLDSIIEALTNYIVNE